MSKLDAEMLKDKFKEVFNFEMNFLNIASVEKAEELVEKYKQLKSMGKGDFNNNQMLMLDERIEILNAYSNNNISIEDIRELWYSE